MEYNQISVASLQAAIDNVSENTVDPQDPATTLIRAPSGPFF